MHKKSVSRILGEEFGHIDLKSEEGKKLIAAKSAHVGEVKAVSRPFITSHNAFVFSVVVVAFETYN